MINLSSNSRYINVWVTPDIFPQKKPLPFFLRYKSVSGPL